MSRELTEALRSALGSGDDLVHATYRHLTRKTRVLGLTLGQWATIAGCLATTYALYKLIPGGGQAVLGVSAFVAGLPAVWALVSPDSDLSLLELARSAVRFSRARGTYLPPGPDLNSEPPRGYRVIGEHPSLDDTGSPLAPSTPEDLWR
ncbi:MAG: hypothetical protein ACSLFR_05700 [Solirubrobacteraceae bacterium]